MSGLSEEVLALSVPYLGPAAKKFLERQTRSHMDGLGFDQLQKGHLHELGKWIEVSAGLLIEKAKAKELADRIRALA